MALAGDLSEEVRSETVRGRAGFFRVGQARDGAWWLIDAEGRPFFAAAANEAEAGAAERLRNWNFTTLGAGAAEALREDGWPWVGTVDFCGAGPVIRAAGVRVPDVFDPDWERRARGRAAEVCASSAAERALVGWLADDGIAWGRGGVTLLQVCLSLEPGFAAYHAAWEFVLALHRGRIEAMAKAWGVPIANKEVVREMTRADEALASRGYWRDNVQWTREMARRYFAGTAAAIRASDGNHLVLGAREEWNAGPAGANVSELAAAVSDVPWVSWREPGALSAGPVWVGDFCWAREEFYGGRGGRLTTVERMLRKGRKELRRLIAAPAVVGYSWVRWRDRPGERAPLGSGLVRADGTEAREHTELVADINGRIGSLRGFSAS